MKSEPELLRNSWKQSFQQIPVKDLFADIEKNCGLIYSSIVDVTEEVPYMQLRIAVCDDHPADRAFVHTQIDAWAHAAGHGVMVEEYSSAESLLFSYEADRCVDVMFLDIELGGMNGMELARRIRMKDRLVQLVFITGYMEYFSDGYDVEALHYLLKPVTEEKLRAVLDRAYQRVSARERALLLALPDETVRILLYEIRFLEVQKNYVTIHADEDYTVKRTLRELEKELDDAFVRTGRSFVVNLRYVKRITHTEVVLKDGTKVPLSRGQYEAVNQAMIRYF